MSTELAHVETLPVKSDPYRLMTIAVERGADVAQLSALMDLQQRYDAEQARKAFYAAKGRFQSMAPVIRKDQKVKFGQTEYSHASLSGIAEQIKAPLAECKLSYRWDIQDSKDEIRVTCILSHEDGHSEINSMYAEPDDSGAKNAIQQRGSAVTYLQRYTLIGVLGLTSANEDDDGKISGAQNVEILRAHNDVLRECIQSVCVVKTAIATNDLLTAFEAWAELSNDEMRALWVAPTKGGIFTTHERAVMKSPEWEAARREFSGTLDKAAAE
jgi:hypothetical protein